MTQPQPELSVIVLTHNTCELTLSCVRSVLADCPAAEIIVVDNASSDGTFEAVQTAFPGVRVILNDANLGFARGNNLGLAAARGPYLLLLNSDTIVQPGALGALVRFIDAHPEAGACGPMLLNEDGSVQPSGRSLPTAWRLIVDMTRMYRLWQSDMFEERGRDYRQVARVGELSGAALMIRREAYERVGGFDPALFAYYEDVDLCKRIGDAGYAIYYVPDARIIHLWARSSRAVPELAYRAGQDSARIYFLKHHGPGSQLVVQLLLAGKECALIAAGLLRGRPDQAAFHRRMLDNALAPVP
jgi:GT2 family glycosyltransferase